jgi:hypothetical protein
MSCRTGRAARNRRRCWNEPRETRPARAPAVCSNAGSRGHPDRRLKIATPLVEGERLEGMTNPGPQFRLMEAESLDAEASSGNSQRTHRVPDADAFDIDGLGAMTVRRCLVRQLQLFVPAHDLGRFGIAIPDIDEPSHLALLHDAARSAVAPTHPERFRRSGQGAKAFAVRCSTGVSSGKWRSSTLVMLLFSIQSIPGLV